MQDLEVTVRQKLQKLTVEVHRINELTVIASNNPSFARQITTAISDQIKMVLALLMKGSPPQKMALFYLIDSIMKAESNSYLSLLEERVLKLFPPTYQSVSTHERILFKKLLKSWKLNPTGYIFPASTLRKLEESVEVLTFDYQAIDNPTAQPQITTQSVLNLLTKAIAFSQSKPQNDPLVAQEYQVLKGLYAYVSTGSVEGKGLVEIYHKVGGMIGPVAPVPVTSVSSRSSNVLPSVPVNLHALNTGSINASIMNTNLNAGGLYTQQYPIQSLNIPSSLFQSFNPLSNRSFAPTPTDIPKLSLTTKHIDTPIPGLHYHLYEAIDMQCKQCGLRFSTSLDGPDAKLIFDSHLDWHFRMKKRMRDKGKKTSSREWYVPVQDWVVEQPVESMNDQVAPVFFGEEEKVEEVVYNIPAESQSRCKVCGEVMDKYFDDDEDIWMLKGAIKVDGDFFHQGCFGDRDSIENTPTLGKRVLESDEVEAKRAKTVL